MYNETKKMNQPVMIAGVLSVLILLFSSSSGLYLFVLRPFGFHSMSTAAILISRIFFWIVTAFAWFYTFKAERQPMLLWGNKKNNLGVFLLSFIVMVFVIMILTGFASSIITAIIHHKEKSEKLMKMIDIFRNNSLLLILTLITAGVTEELVFRGYLLPRFALLFKNDYIAIFISSLLFALMHAGYGTISNIVGPFIIGVVCAVHYWKYRNIVYLMIFHFLWDLFAFLLLLNMKK